MDNEWACSSNNVIEWLARAHACLSVTLLDARAHSATILLVHVHAYLLRCAKERLVFPFVVVCFHLYLGLIPLALPTKCPLRPLIWPEMGTVAGWLR